MTDKLKSQIAACVGAAGVVGERFHSRHGMEIRSDYTIVRTRFAEPGHPDAVFIIDNGGRKSVTNDAERVCEEVVHLLDRAEFPTTTRIFYCDSDSRWDELEHEHGVFRCFRPIDGAPEAESLIPAPLRKVRP